MHSCRCDDDEKDACDDRREKIRESMSQKGLAGETIDLSKEIYTWKTLASFSIQLLLLTFSICSMKSTHH